MANVSTLLNKDEHKEELIQRVDTPLQIGSDPNADGRPYIICDYNRDGDLYRSPWTNSFYPVKNNDAVRQPLLSSRSKSTNNINDPLRQLEIQANEDFSIYQQLYYGTKENPNDENNVSSVYLWDTSTDKKNSNQGNQGSHGNAFAAIFLIRKILPSSSSSTQSNDGYWNSIHVIDVSPISPTRTCTYKLTSTLFVAMNPSKNKHKTAMSCCLERQIMKTTSIDKDGKMHLQNMGKMIEDMECNLRSKIDSIYIQKTKEIATNLRPRDDYEMISHKSPSTADKNTSDEKKSIRKFKVGHANPMHASLLSQAIFARAAKNKDDEI